MIIALVKNKDGVVLSEINNIANVEINQVINSDSASNFTFSVDNNEAVISNFKESNTFEIWEDQELLHEGFFAGMEATLDTITVALSSVGIWNKKIILVNKQYNASTSICSILSDILDEINARDDTGYTLNCFTDQTITEEKNYSSGTTYFSILSDLAKSGFEFKISQRKIYFQETIGIDRTQDNDLFFEFYYNQKSPEGNNIQQVNTIIPNSIFNAITAKDFNDNVVTVTDSTSIVEFGRLEKVISVDGDLTTTANEELAKSKDSTKDISIEPLLDNFNSVGLGDLCKVEIVSVNNLLNYSGSAKILEKNMTISEKKTISLKISTTGIKILNFLQRFTQVENNVNKLLIK